MRASITALSLLGALSAVHADLHHLIVGTFGTESLYTLEFDDSALTLNLIQNLTVSTASSWIALSHDKKNLYGTALSSGSSAVPAFVSYALGNATDITYSNLVDLGGNCSSSKAIFVMAATESPYAVYGTPFGGTADCGAVISVDESGVLSELIQNYTYKSTSAVHGLAMNTQNTFLYSADDSGNTLWTHSVDNTTGELTYVASLDGPATGSDPRHVAIHPEGQYLYVILEGANELAQYTVDQSTGIPSFQNVTYPLIPSGSDSSSFWSDEVALSYSTNYLWATSRARSTNATGYISAFSLATDGSITSQLFLSPTTNSGGTANSVSPSPFTDTFVALTDSSVGFVEIWQLAENGTSASVVARADLDDGGCCANAVWYS
ncbi:3-carboxy-cis,cis-mucoante lactonizing enzyme [Mollisia scopiformis]|uniref:3-carboxy-cis,cis-mucoante lactonizing enzyme n=1 Tax=Mollisia scopiformis TaxID=149040 RepID=A0A194XNI7_MOLSC|nr:3-carboxy-cis,cis-mucoante lactonizing enzyme [Mollisia scopiformis]KUJ21723.1 3-carboxy-cis,cis-mucoante lactonizing enzyme [Mollisia scopiformis]